MSRSKSPTLNHRLEYCAYRAFEWILGLTSLETVFRLGEFAGRIVHRLNKNRRNQVIRNLRFAFGDEKSQTEIEQLAAEVFERTGANFLTSLKIPFLSDEEILRHLHFERLDDIMKATDEGGIVMVSPHMGNWELLAQAIFLAEGKFRVGTHYRPLNNALINSVVERRRKRRGLELFAKRTSTHRLINFVREGGAMGVLADQRVGERGAACLFFGRPTTCSPLPHLIAKRGKGQLISLSCETVGTARWKITFRHIPTITAQACADSIEQDWRRAPVDVFWFEDRWRIRGNEPLAFLKKYKDDFRIPRPLRAVNISSDIVTLPFPSKLLSQEHVALDFETNDKSLKDALEKISDAGATPVDLFVAPGSQKDRIKKLMEKVLVLASEEL
jgi:KDO2-lipid IV(A) lauroyltransferase